MPFESAAFGPLEIDEESTLTFPQGLPGLEHCTRFKLFHRDEQDPPILYFLQSLDDPAVAFSLIPASHFGVDYEITLSDEEAVLLQLEQPSDVAILLIVYGGEAAADGQVKAQLRAPLVINTVTRLGLQKAGLRSEVVFRPTDS